MSNPPPPNTIPNYFVVPIVGSPLERVVTCLYFLSKGDDWVAVNPNKLSTRHHDIACVRQPTYEEAKRYVPNVDPTLVLFAAVAKTRDANTGMPVMVAADDNRQVVISVYPKTSRSLILVFQRFNLDGSYGELVATVDPDVQHGSDGSPDDCPQG